MADDGRLDDLAVEQRLDRLDDLLGRLERTPGPTGEAAIEAVQVLTEVYGEALGRLLRLCGPEVTADAADDMLLRHLMVLHGLHPGSVEQRVERVLTDLRPLLQAQGAGVELLAVDDDVARVRLSAGCGCSAGKLDTLASVVRDSVLALAPELRAVDTAVPPQGGTTTLIPLEALFRSPTAAGARQ